MQKPGNRATEVNLLKDTYLFILRITVESWYISDVIFIHFPFIFHLNI